MSPQSPRTVLITGSTSGIGEAIAVAFARDGDRVIVNGRDEGRTAEAAERVREAAGGAGEVVPVAADVATDEGVATMRAAVPDVDVLVNNLGIFAASPVFEIPDDEWRRFFEVNVLSGIRLARQYAPGMRARG